MNDNPYESPTTIEADRTFDAAQAAPLFRLRYFVLAMLVLLSVVTYLDRICIGVAAADIQRDLGISDEGWGWVLGAFLLAYGLFEIPSGALGDRIGQRKVLTRIVLWWSAFTALTPFARNFYALVGTRFMFGAGGGGGLPQCVRVHQPVVSNWGASAGTGARVGREPIGRRVNATHRHAAEREHRLGELLLVVRRAGLAWAAVWMIWFRDNPAEHPAMTAGELQEIGHSATAAHGAAPWDKLFLQPQLWLIVGMYWFYVFGFIFFMFWMPKFLAQGRGMSQREMGWTVGLMFATGAVGNLIGGWLSDGLSKRHGLAIGRKVIGVTCLAACGLLMIMAALTPGKFVAAGLLIAAFGIADAMLPCSWAICLDVGRHYSGAVSGAMNSAGQAAGYICTVLFGYLVKLYGYDRPVLFLAPNLLIAAVVFALIDPTRPLVDEPTESGSAE